MSYSQLLNRFPAALSYSLPLLVNFDAIGVNHGGRLPAMGGVGPLVVVESDPMLDASLVLRTLHGILVKSVERMTTVGSSV